MTKHDSYTVFQGRAGDHNDLAIPGAQAIGAALASRKGTRPTIVGTPEPALNTNWHKELDAALPALRAMQAHLDQVLASGACSIAATSRCAVSLATLPIVAKHRPDACVVWMDCHADLNTPASTTTGYLGGLALAGPCGLWESSLGSGLALDRIVLVGQRDLDPFEKELIERHAIPLIERGNAWMNDLHAAIGGRPVYLHLDCDVLAPGIVPTDYVQEDGLSLGDLTACCAVISRHECVGLEIAEFQNAWAQGGDPVSCAPLLDAMAPLLDRG